MKSRIRIEVVSFLSIGMLVFGAVSVQSTTLLKMNVADLTSYGDLIIVAKVLSLTDGFDGNGLPYTEVTVSISETLKGSASGTYSFKQFGLLQPRDLGNGMTYVGVSPDGWPKFQVGEKAILFLAAITSLGFQTPVGLLQGKFMIDRGQVCNAVNNLGLFSNVSGYDPAMLTDDEKKLLSVTAGPVSSSAFKSFVTKAVENNWF